MDDCKAEQEKKRPTWEASNLQQQIQHVRGNVLLPWHTLSLAKNDLERKLKSMDKMYSMTYWFNRKKIMENTSTHLSSRENMSWMAPQPKAKTRTKKEGETRSVPPILFFVFHYIYLGLRLTDSRKLTTRTYGTEIKILKIHRKKNSILKCDEQSAYFQ